MTAPIDVETISQFVPLPIGVPGAPWAHQTIDGEMEVIQDERNPLLLYSQRAYPEAMGDLYRKMPAPGMLEAFNALLQKTRPNNKNRMAYFVSDPGVGKSFLATLLGKARDKRGPIITDAGGRNLEYLLFETVFDIQQSKTLIESIDNALKENSLNVLSINALKAFTPYFSEDKDGRRSMDWNGLSSDSSIDHNAIHQALEIIRTAQGWDAKAMAVGFRVKEGPLVQAHREGRDIVIDELNKCKRGSEGALQQVWQVLNGEIAEHTVTLGSNGTFTFRRGGQGIVIATGNHPKDGEATHSISDSFDSRVPKFPIPNFTEQDWQHRICQILTGLPISTLHRMQKGQWKNDEWVLDDEEGFTKLLYTLRTVGLSEEEKRNIPDLQMTLIANWKQVLEKSQKMGEFYHKWADMADPKSAFYKTGPGARILEEVETPENPLSLITPRLVIDHINAATDIFPTTSALKDNNGFNLAFDWNTPITIQPLTEALEENFGTRLNTIMMQTLKRSADPKDRPKYRGLLLALAEEHGITPQTPDLLDISAERHNEFIPSQETTRWQTLIANNLRALHGVSSSVSNDAIVSLEAMERALEHLNNTQTPAAVAHPVAANCTHTYLRVPNPDSETAGEKPFITVSTDANPQSQSTEEIIKAHPPATLLDSTTLLTSLTMPGEIGQSNLSALWNRNIVSENNMTKKPIDIFNNTDSSKVGCTTVICKMHKSGKDVYEKLHIFNNSKTHKTLVVGSVGIADGLKEHLKEYGITYVNGSEKNANSILKEEIANITRIQTQQQNMFLAFQLRNGISERPKSLLVDPNNAANAVDNLSTILSHPDDIKGVLATIISAKPVEPSIQPTATAGRTR